MHRRHKVRTRDVRPKLFAARGGAIHQAQGGYVRGSLVRGVEPLRAFASAAAAAGAASLARADG